MNNITLKQLRYFAAVAKYSHFGHAAETCAVSQPALSVQIKELEESLGWALFERSSRQVRLTTQGRAFLIRAEEILRSVDDLGELARAAHDQWVGQLRMGIIPTIAPYLLPRIVDKLTETVPGIDLRFRETHTSHLLKELAEGRIDTAILALPVSEPDIAEYPLFEENFVLIRPESHKDRPVPSPEHLREMRLLLLEEGHCFRDQALSFCSVPSEQPRETLDASSLSTLVQMVGAGIGVTLIPEMAVPVETRSASVSLVRFPDPQPSRTIGMIWRRTSPLAPKYRQIADILKDIPVTGQ